MFTIYDYLKYYKDKELVDVNDIDYLLLSLLSYLPIENFKGKKTFNEFINYSLLYQNIIKKGITKKVYELLDIIKNSKRYENIKVYNSYSIKNNDAHFAAITFRFKNICIISFKGSDTSYISWIENFRLLYKFPTNTQNIALKYIHDNITVYDKNIILVGHSKGGNLAISSLYLSDNLLSNRIKKVYNFDGPGLRYEEYNSKRFDNIKNKIINYIPTGSIVGVLMENENYNVVKNNEITWKEHYPTSWNVFGEFFVLGKLSKASLSIHNSSTNKIREFKYEQMEKAFEELYTTLGNNYDLNFEFNYKVLKNIYLNMKKINPQISEYLELLFNSIFKIKGRNIK